MVEQAQLAQLLHGRRDAIADRWLEAVAGTSFSPFGAKEMHQHLRRLTDQVIALLRTEPLDPCQAEAIGTSLVRLHYTQPEALGRTQEVLAHQLVEGLPANQVAALQPRLATLLAHLATGFCQQTHTTILSNQEQIRLAVTSELQRLQESLRAERNFVSAILDTAGALVIVTDIEGRIVRFNQACVTLTGYSVEEIRDTYVWDVLLPAANREQAKAFYTRLRKNGTEDGPFPREVQGYWRTRDGTPRLISWWYTPLRAGDGSIEHMIATGINITEQFETQKALRESEEKLRAQYKGIPIPTYTWQRVGDDFQLIDYNDAADAISQHQIRNLVGIRAGDLHGDRPEVREDLARCYTERIPIQREMRHRYETTGETRHLAITYGFVPPDLVLVHTEDITERKRAEAQLIQADKMASMGVMAGAITHELKNPLTIISSNAQVLRDHPCDTPVHIQCAKNIHDTTQRLSKIIDNLVRFARPENDTMMETDLHSVLEETLPLVAHLMSSQQVTLQQKLEAGLPHIFGNPALLQQVFTNLILNACNAMPDGGTLTIATSTNRSEEAQIAFTDTGRGIPPEDLPKIFDPFFTTMPLGEGIGLGLSVSYSIIQLHGGNIAVESDVGRGTTFTVRLPAMDGLRGNRGKNHATGPHPAGGR